MIDPHDHGDSSFATSTPPFVETCLQLARVAVTDCFYRVWDRIAEKRWDRWEKGLAADGYVVCPACEAADDPNTCRVCKGIGCVTFEENALFEEQVQAIMRGEVPL